MKKKITFPFYIGLFLFLTSCGGEAPSDEAPVKNLSELSEKEIIKDFEEAFRWSYPMMAMTLNNTVQYETTLNAFYNMKKAADEKSQRDKGFNAETLYSAGALDLSKEPMVFTMPAVGDRFVVVPIQDAWGNIDNVIGTRTEGNDGGSFLISGPDWHGKVPAGMKHFKVATNIAFLPGRSMVSGLEDAKYFANNVLDKFTITPLSRWGKGDPNPNRDSETNPLLSEPTKSYTNILANMSFEEYYTKLNEWLVKNPPYDYDKPVLERFKVLGIGAGLKFDASKFSKTVKESLEKFIKNDPQVTAGIMVKRGRTYESAKVTSRFKTNYWERYVQLFGGIGGNLMEDAMYYWINVDQDSVALDGAKNYIVHFDKNKIPKTKAFWSMTLYNQDFFLPMDLELNRHVLNSSSKLEYNKDGSLDFYLQKNNPGKEKESNWLPTPAKSGYFIVMRVYWPGKDLLEGKWNAPRATLNKK